MSDVAIDDLSLSPECFGLNIPVNELKGYDYYNPGPFLDNPYKKETHADFINTTCKCFYKFTLEKYIINLQWHSLITDYEFSTCGVKGTFGPTQANCTTAYNNTAMKVKVLNETNTVGMQKWVAPQEGFYT